MSTRTLSGRRPQSGPTGLRDRDAMPVHIMRSDNPPMSLCGAEILGEVRSPNADNKCAVCLDMLGSLRVYQR